MAYLTSNELCKRLNSSKATLWRWQQTTQKLFKEPLPPPVKSSNGSPSLWDEKQIAEWEAKYFRNNESLVT